MGLLKHNRESLEQEAEFPRPSLLFGVYEEEILA